MSLTIRHAARMLPFQLVSAVPLKDASEVHDFGGGGGKPRLICPPDKCIYILFDIDSPHLNHLSLYCKDKSMLVFEAVHHTVGSGHVAVMPLKALPGQVSRFTASVPQTAKLRIQMGTCSQQRSCLLPTLVCNCSESAEGKKQ